jgi:hypothetical protein
MHTKFKALCVPALACVAIAALPVAASASPRLFNAGTSTPLAVNTRVIGTNIINPVTFEYPTGTGSFTCNSGSLEGSVASNDGINRFQINLSHLFFSQDGNLNHGCTGGPDGPVTVWVDMGQSLSTCLSGPGSPGGWFALGVGLGCSSGLTLNTLGTSDHCVYTTSTEVDFQAVGSAPPLIVRPVVPRRFTLDTTQSSPTCRTTITLDASYWELEQSNTQALYTAA